MATKRQSAPKQSRYDVAVNAAGDDPPRPPVGLRKLKGRGVKIIGVGGIGSALVAYLSRFLWSQDAKALDITVDLIDGDHYELKNKTRMSFLSFQNFTNKAVAQAMTCAEEFGDRLLVRPIPEYVAEENIASLIGEQSVVFLAVDNFRTRKLVSDWCEKLQDVVLFSGGNDGVESGQDGTFGNVQIYERHNGADVRNPITRFHPEIQTPGDRAPYELSCEELAQSGAPQLLFTNLAVASAMLNAFYSWLHNQLNYEEAYIDIVMGQVQPTCRWLSFASSNKI